MNTTMKLLSFRLGCGRLAYCFARLRGVSRFRAGMLLLLVGILAGCGGGEEGEAPKPPASPVGKLIAMDGFGAVKPNMVTRVDLSAFVRGPGATLTAFESLDEKCHADKLSGLTVEVTIEEGGLCKYTFAASNGVSAARAAMNVLASSRAAPILYPLSHTMTVGGGDATFDLPALLGADWPAGYNLDPASLVVQGGAEQGNAVASGDNIIYTPPGTPGWNRIVFILKNSARPGEDALGTLYVTVSDVVNQAPIIGMPKYDYSAQTGVTMVMGEGRTLDLASLPNLNIRDPEGRDWRLVEVQSYSASVVPRDPTSVTNKQFEFTASTIGNHIVGYIVADHEGGFSMGLMSITVGPKEGVRDWADITIGSTTFYATPRYSEAIARGVVPAEGVWDSRVNNTIAGMTGVQGRAYCNGWRLATEGDLTFLRTTSAVAAERAKYPTLRSYLVSDGGAGYLTYDLTTGASAPYVPGSSPNQYVICVKADPGNFAYVPTPNTPISGYVNTAISDGATWWPLGQVVSDGEISDLTLVSSINAGTGTLSAANFRLNPARCSSAPCMLEAYADAQEYGSATIRLVSQVDNSSTLDIGPITFWQNAKLDSVTVTRDHSTPNGKDMVAVAARLVDKDGNRVPAGTSVKMGYRFSPSAYVVNTKPALDPLSGLADFSITRAGEVTLVFANNKGSPSQVMLELLQVAYGIPSGSQFVNTNFIQQSCQADIFFRGLLVACPPSKAQAERVAPFYSTYEGLDGQQYVLFTAAQAKNYCHRINKRLPSLSELRAFRMFHVVRGDPARNILYDRFGWVSKYVYPDNETGYFSEYSHYTSDVPAPDMLIAYQMELNLIDYRGLPPLVATVACVAGTMQE